MSLPKAVKQAEERAQRLYEEFYNAQANTESQDASQPATETDPQPDTTGDQSTDLPPENTVSNGMQTPASALVSTTEPDDSQDDDWEHRYKVLSGKYNSEVPRLAADNRELKSVLKRLEDELKVLKEKAGSIKQSYLKPEEIEEYGEGLIDVVRRAAREEVAAKEDEISVLKAEMESLKNKTTKSVEIDFYEELSRAVPDWMAINENKTFLRWLDGYDELTGYRRQDLLAQAEADRDAKRVGNFFNAFKKTNQSWAATANQSLESQVVPDSVKKTSSPPAKKIWTRAEINSFYAELRKGAIDDKRAVAIEADIQAAIVEGRVR